MYFLGCFLFVFGSMCCASGSAKKFKHDVSCVLPANHVRIYFKKLFHGERDALHSIKLTQMLEKTLPQ